MKAGVALGSNLGDRLANLRAARNEIGKLNSVSSPLLTSATISQRGPLLKPP